MTLKSGNIIKVYFCELDTDRNIIRYHVHTAEKSNGHPIRYKESDMKLALKNYIIGYFIVLGVNQENIIFYDIPKFKHKFPAIYYYTDAFQGGIISEGISCLIKGKHFRIGVMYEPSCKNEAKKKLKHFLNSFSLN
jgi:hypothetical protein